jgi:large subunit ribosomal protein L24
MATIVRFHVKRGDTVEVISGNHKGAVGKILQIRAKKQQVLIEGVRMIKKHTRRSQDSPQGAIIEREGPIHVSNVKISAVVEKSKAAKPKTEKPKAAPKPKSKKAS